MIYPGIQPVFTGVIKTGVGAPPYFGGLTLPPGYVFRTDEDGTDIIGLSVSDYAKVDPAIRSIFFSAPDAKRADADIVTLALASPLLNIGTMLGVAGKIVVLYPTGTPRATLNKVLRYIKDTPTSLLQFYSTSRGLVYGTDISTSYPSGRYPGVIGVQTTPAAPFVYNRGAWVGGPYKNELALGSENFVTSWTNGRLTVGSVEIDGSYKITLAQTTGAQYLRNTRTVAIGGKRGLSILFKTGTVDKVTLRVCGAIPAVVANRYVVFDLVAKTHSTIAYANYKASIEEVEGGFIRCSLINTSIEETSITVGFSLGIAEETASCGFIQGDYLFAKWGCEVISDNDWPFVSASYTALTCGADATGKGISLPATGILKVPLGYGYSPGDITLGIFADPHYSGQRPTASVILSNVSELIGHFNLASVDAIIGVGDAYHGYSWATNAIFEADVITFESQFDSASAPEIAFVSGNHDLEEGYPVTTFSRFTKRNYTRDIGEHFRLIIYSNAETGYNHQTTAAADTLVWLADELEAARVANKKIIIATHARIDEDYPGNTILGFDSYLGAGTVSLSATTGNGVIATSSSAAFTAEMVGHYLFALHGSTWGMATIVSLNSASEAVINVVRSFGASGTASIKWVIDGLTNFSYNSSEQRAIIDAAKAGGSEIVCVLIGHTHQDYQATINGIIYRTFEYCEFSPVGFLVRISTAGELTIFSDNDPASAHKNPSKASGVVAGMFSGISSANVAADLNLLTCNDAVAGLLYMSTGGALKSTDGTNVASVTVAGGWTKSDVIAGIVDVRGDTFRVGYSKSPFSTITWGEFAPCTGRLAVSPTLRVSFSATTPLYFSKLHSWEGTVADADILEMLVID